MQQKLNLNIKINNKEFTLEKNYTILQACLWVYRNKFKDSIFEIPRFCFHEKLSIAGNCRMCLVEVLKSPKPVASCAMPIMPNMVIYTNTALVKKAREGVLEFILANHPLDCPICDQGGECDLQDQSMLFGGDIGRFYEYKRAVEDKECGPFVKTVMTRCIHCTRCVRFLSEIAGISDLGVLGRGNKMEIGTYLQNILHSEVSGNIIDLCPVGALTSKPYTFTARPWELITKQSVDIIDSLGADIRVDIRGTEVMRILPRYNSKINDMWISDITRFYYDSVKRQRLCIPMYKNKDSFFCRSSWKVMLMRLWNYYYLNKFILKRKINLNCIGGNFIDGEALLILKEFSNINGSKAMLAQNNFYSNVDLRENYLLTFNKQDLKKADCLILLGSNLRLESPIYNLYIRQLFLKKKLLIFTNSSSINLTYYVKSLGLNINNFIKLLEGKNVLTNLLSKFKNITCIAGMSIFMRYDSNSILSLLQNFQLMHKTFKFGVIQKNMSVINSNELGFLPSLNKFVDYDMRPETNIITSPVNYIINLGNYDLPIKSKFNKYQIFIGHHGYTNSLLKNINILLPSNLFLEKFSSNLSVEGNPRVTKKILVAPGEARLDWEILYIINTFFKKKNQKLRNLVFKNEKNSFQSLKTLFTSFKLFLYNSILIYFKTIFFNKKKKVNNISVNFNYFSLIMSLLLMKNNYLILFFNNNNFVKNLYFYIFKYLDLYFFNLLLINSIYLKDSDLKLKLNHRTPLLNKDQIEANLLKNLKFDKIQYLKIANTPFNNYIDSIYNYDILSKSSIFLAKAAKEFKKTNSNYL